MRYSIAIMVALSLAAFNITCQGAVWIHGWVIERNVPSRVVMNLWLGDSIRRIEGAAVRLFPAASHGKFEKLSERENARSDKNGEFFLYASTAPFHNLDGAVITAIDGYITDTLFFEYNSMDTVEVLLCLHKVPEHKLFSCKRL